ncbi:conjugal transfer protein TraJ [Neisseria gonorrhoeae]
MAGARKRPKYISVYVSEEEWKIIESLAKSVGLSQSAYLKLLGLGYKPASVYDGEAVKALAKINADQGRLGGLIKMWLANDERLMMFDHDQLAKAIFGVLEQIGEMQESMLEIVRSRRILAAKKIG